MLRQQEQQPDGTPNLSLADFVAPPRAAASRTTSARSPITAGIGAEELAARFERDLDDYHAIMVKALADRLAEAMRRMAARAGPRATGATAPASSCRART